MNSLGTLLCKWLHLAQVLEIPKIWNIQEVFGVSQAGEYLRLQFIYGVGLFHFPNFQSGHCNDYE